MSDSQGPRRYAFLVGIDLYLNNGSRKLQDGKVLSLGNLQGCFNDIMGIEALLRKRYEVESVDILASPLPENTIEGSARFKDDRRLWPTYSNIKRKFENIYSIIKPGDLLFFHFSGFGALLTPVKRSSFSNDTKDPALLTADFCCGQPAVRVRELNEWLKRFTDREVHVTVSLDSCHSGRSSGETAEQWRTPNNWPESIPNLLSDQYPSQQWIQDQLVHRKPIIEPSVTRQSILNQDGLNRSISGLHLRRQSILDQRGSGLSIFDEETTQKYGFDSVTTGESLKQYVSHQSFLDQPDRYESLLTPIRPPSTLNLNAIGQPLKLYSSHQSFLDQPDRYESLLTPFRPLSTFDHDTTGQSLKSYSSREPVLEQHASGTSILDVNIGVLPGNDTSTQSQTQWSLGLFQAITLMTACQSNERAAEKNMNGSVYGAYTYELLRYLDQDSLFITDAIIQTQIRSRLEGLQTPEICRLEGLQPHGIYNQEKTLSFFHRSFETYVTTPILCRIDGNTAIIPVGKAHGIYPHTEFAPYPRISNVVFSVQHVDNFECRAAIPYEFGNPVQRRSCLVIPLRWSLGESALRVAVDPEDLKPLQPSRWSSWRQSSNKSLSTVLKNWISSPIEIVSFSPFKTNTDIIRLLRGQQPKYKKYVHISGPSSLVGYAGPIHYINIPLDDKRFVTKSAFYLAHLARFKQLLDLRDIKPSETRPFSVTLKPLNITPWGPRYSFKKTFQFAITNNSTHELYFVIVVFGAEFSVEQLYPASSTPASVPPCSRKLLRFSMKPPECSPQIRKIIEQHDRRTIIRAIVARSNCINWKSVELPRLWDVGQANFNDKPSQESFVEIEDASDEWWVCDQKIMTTLERVSPFYPSYSTDSLDLFDTHYPSLNSFDSLSRHWGDEETYSRRSYMKKEIVPNPDTHLDISGAGPAPGHGAVESEVFRNISTTLSQHFNNTNPYNKFSPVISELPEFFDLEESACIDLYTYDLSFDLRWQLPEFIASEMNDNWDIGSVLTINGTIREPYAGTCKEYVKSFWPTLRFEAVNSMLRHVQNVMENKPVKKAAAEITREAGLIKRIATGIILSDNLTLSGVYSETEIIRIEASGKPYDLICFAQLLAWLSAVFRIPKYGTISKSCVMMARAVKSRLELLQLSSGRECFEITLQHLQEIDSAEKYSCWRPLLNNTVIAEGFPIRKRNGGVGLELPFHAMLALSCVSHSLQTPEGIMFKGFSSALVPQVQINSGSVQWHYIQSPNPEEPLDIEAIRHLFTSQAKYLSIELLAAARSFLGYNSNVYVLTGTQQSGYESADVSGAHTYTPGFMMETKLTPTMGLSKFGTLSVGAHITYARGVYARAQHEEIRTDDRLFGSKDRPLLMYDVQNKTAFLIPEICAILELAHVWAKRQKDGPEILEKMPFSEPRWDGGKASYDAIMEFKDVKLREAYAEEPAVWFMSLLRELFKAFEVRRSVRRDNHSKYLQVRKKHVIRGWELSDIAAFEDSWEKQIDLGASLGFFKTSNRWDDIPAENEDMTVLFYKGLTQPISPANEEQACKMWTPLPQGYLLATIGSSDDKPQLTKKLFWRRPISGKIFEPCSEGLCEECTRAQLLVTRVSRTPLPDKPNGAVIFGNGTKEKLVYRHVNTTNKSVEAKNKPGWKAISDNMWQWDALLDSGDSSMSAS